MSEKVDISVKHLSAIERGLTFVSADLLEKLAFSLETPVSRFFITCQDVFGDDDRVRYCDVMLGTIDKIVEKHLVQAMKNIKFDIHQK